VAQRIVVVDDIALNRRVFASLVAELDGVEVVSFADSSVALERAPFLGASLFVLDYRMPAPDGMAMLSAIRADPRIGQTPVVIVTAAEERDVCYAALERGASDFLVRPIDPREFTRRIGNLLTLDALRREAARHLEGEERASRLYARRLEMIWRDGSAALDDAAFLRNLIADAAATLVDGRVFSAAIARLDGTVAIEVTGADDDAIAPGDMLDVFTARGLEALTDRPPERRGAGGWRASIGLPFRAGAQHYALTFRSHEPLPEPFTAFDESFVETVATLCGTRLQQRAHYEHLRFQSEHDTLTGILNRASLRVAGTAARATSDKIAAIVLNVDNFRQTNDAFGQQTGDALLVEVAARIAAVATGGETVARLGGDAFGVLIVDCASREAAGAAAGRYLRAFQYPFGTGDRDDTERIFLGASAGIALLPGDAPDYDVLLAHATAACYAAKAAGRGRAAFFDAALEETHVAARLLRNELATALARGEFALYFQPHVDLRTARICGAEALIRWHHPVRGLVPPGAFIPFAERHGLAGEIGAWVMAEAARASQSWRRADANFRVWFNLSAAELRDQTLVARLRGLSGDLAGLGVEVTESVAMENVVETLQVMGELRDLGVELALDDFGTGYSSLAHLRRLPLNVVKIDRAFVSGLPSDEFDVAIVDAVVSISRSYGFATLGEGIEHADQTAFLLRAGCTLGQGFLYGRPVPADDFSTLLGQRPLRVSA
jgi:diguanylate cyclase (GGDEF)-like protein